MKRSGPSAVRRSQHYESSCEKLGNLSESCVLDNSLAFISLFPYRCKIEGRYVIPYSEIQLNFSKTRNQHSATKVNICFDKHKPDYGKVSVYPEVPSSFCRCVRRQTKSDLFVHRKEKAPGSDSRRHRSHPNHLKFSKI